MPIHTRSATQLVTMPLVVSQVLLGISLLFLIGCGNDPSQFIQRDEFYQDARRPIDGPVTTPQAADLSVSVDLNKRVDVLQGESIRIVATVRNNSAHASNEPALLFFYSSNDQFINPAIFDIGADYAIKESAVEAIEKKLSEGYGLDPVYSEILRVQSRAEQNIANDNRQPISAALDPVFASLITEPLPSGETFTPPGTINIPSTADSGTFYYGACVVLDIFSCDSLELTVGRVMQPDLRAVGVPIFNNVGSDGYYANEEEVRVEGTVRNGGGMAAENVVVELYRVGNNNPIGSKTIPSIDAESNHKVDFDAFQLSSYSAGIHTEQYYLQIAPVENEIDPKNNRSDSSGLIVYVAGAARFNPIDADADLLIDVHNLDMLGHIAYNLAGTSYKDSADAEGVQCGEGADQPCIGYELMRSFDFATASSYAANRVNSDWRPNNSDPERATNGGWYLDGTFSAIFEGNGYIIRNLYSRNTGQFGGVKYGNEKCDSLCSGGKPPTRSAGGAAYGLFSRVSGTVRNLTVEDSAIYGSDYTDYIGTVVGYLLEGGKAINVSALRGVVNSGGAKLTEDYFDNLGHEHSVWTNLTADQALISGGMDIVGGLVGANAGTIVASSSAVTVIGSHDGQVASYVNGEWLFADKLGGLVGDNAYHGSIISSYSLSALIGDNRRAGSQSSDRMGGIAGTNYGDIFASYSLSNLNSQGAADFIGGIASGFGAVGVAAIRNESVVASTYTTAAIYAGGVGQSSSEDNCVATIIPFIIHEIAPIIHHSYFFGYMEETKLPLVCSADNDRYILKGTYLDQLDGSNTGWATAQSADNGISTRAWAYGGGRAAPALKYADYDGSGGTDYCGEINGTNYSAGNLCSSNTLLPGQPLTDQGDTTDTAYAIDTPFYPGGGISIPATITAGDNDYFEITLVKDGEITIESSHPRGVDMQVLLYNSRNNLVEYDDDDGPGNNFRIYRYLPRGVYRIRAYAHGNDHGSYILRIQMTGI